MQKRPREFAAYCWFIGHLEHVLQRRSAVREAESLLGFSDGSSPKPVPLTEAQMKLELEAMGQTGIRHEDGFGIKYLSVQQVHDAFPVDD